MSPEYKIRYPVASISLEEKVGNIKYEERNCKNVSKDIFFPKKVIDSFVENGVENIKTSQSFQKEIEKAKSICQDCDIKDQCLIVAIENNERDGVFGGEYFGGRNGYKVRKKINNVKEN